MTFAGAPRGVVPGFSLAACEGELASGPDGGEHLGAHDRRVHDGFHAAGNDLEDACGHARPSADDSVGAQ